MNEFSPRTERVASVVSAGERGPASVRSGNAAPLAGLQADAGAQQDTQLTERSAATANYAKLQADIADVVARFDPPRPNSSELVQQADAALMAMMPQPVMVLPLPPTDQEMIDFVAQVAQSIAGQAAIARAAHARVSPALVDAAAG